MAKFRVGQSDHLTKLKIFETYLKSQSKKILCRENFLNQKSLKKAKLVADQLMDYVNKAKIGQKPS